jgi:hypothetical protein
VAVTVAAAADIIMAAVAAVDTIVVVAAAVVAVAAAAEGITVAEAAEYGLGLRRITAILTITITTTIVDTTGMTAQNTI